LSCSVYFAYIAYEECSLLLRVVALGRNTNQTNALLDQTFKIRVTCQQHSALRKLRKAGGKCPRTPLFINRLHWC
jgi:hypothetical protein